MSKPRRTVKRIVDGDTFEVARRVGGSRFVRLAGVNAPEKHARGGRKATNTLRGLIGGQKVIIDPVARDSYGRVVAKVKKSRKSVNKHMKDKGY